MREFSLEILQAVKKMYLQHNFDRTATLEIMLFEFLILSLAVMTIIWMKNNEKNGLLRFGAAVSGLFIHQFFTSPMWHNYKMGWWAYIYQDISWISTLAWASFISLTIAAVNRKWPKVNEFRRFFIYLIILTPLSMIYESIMMFLGVGGYAPEVLDILSGYTFLGIPAEGFFYIPVFMALVVSFTRYWSFYFSDMPVIPVRKPALFRSILIAFTGIVLFEITVEPMVINSNFPSWSYMFRDISIILTGFWIILCFMVINSVDRFLIHFNLMWKFVSYMLAVFFTALPIELLLMNFGYRLYSPSTSAAFSGIKIPYTDLPMEVSFGVPLYFALIIAFIKYFEILCYNNVRTNKE